MRRVEPDLWGSHTHWPHLQTKENTDTDTATGSNTEVVSLRTRSRKVHFGTTTPHVAYDTTDLTNAPEDHQRYMNPGHDRPSWCEKWSGNGTGSKSDPSTQSAACHPHTPQNTKYRQKHTSAKLTPVHSHVRRTPTHVSRPVADTGSVHTVGAHTRKCKKR